MFLLPSCMHKKHQYLNVQRDMCKSNDLVQNISMHKLFNVK